MGGTQGRRSGLPRKNNKKQRMGEGWVLIILAPEGPGRAPRQQHHLWRRFWQTRAQRSVCTSRRCSQSAPRATELLSPLPTTGSQGPLKYRGSMQNLAVPALWHQGITGGTAQAAGGLSWRSRCCSRARAFLRPSKHTFLSTFTSLSLPFPFFFLPLPPACIPTCRRSCSFLAGFSFHIISFARMQSMTAPALHHHSLDHACSSCTTRLPEASCPLMRERAQSEPFGAPSAASGRSVCRYAALPLRTASIFARMANVGMTGKFA